MLLASISFHIELPVLSSISLCKASIKLNQLKCAQVEFSNEATNICIVVASQYTIQLFCQTIAAASPLPIAKEGFWVSSK